jgi:Phasin protein
VAPLAVLTKGAQEISRAWFDVMQDRLAKNIGAMNRLASCRSLQHFLAVQSSAGVDACVRGQCSAPIDNLILPVCES